MTKSGSIEATILSCDKPYSTDVSSNCLIDFIAIQNDRKELLNSKIDRGLTPSNNLPVIDLFCAADVGLKDKPAVETKPMEAENSNPFRAKSCLELEREISTECGGISNILEVSVVTEDGRVYTIKGRDLKREQELKDRHSRVKELHKELIQRADTAFGDKKIDDSMPKMELLLSALKDGKDTKPGANGTVELSDKPLSRERRFELHQALVSDFTAIADRIKRRDDYAFYLLARNEPDEAKKIWSEANAVGERLQKTQKVTGQELSPLQLMLVESKRLLEDGQEERDPVRSDAMRKAFLELSRFADVVPLRDSPQK